MMVWATRNWIGCTINMCYNMNIWGMTWAKGVYLVCNYSRLRNWCRHAAYKHGQPCAACPPSYDGGCKDNFCFRERLFAGTVDHHLPEEKDNNYDESEDLRASLPPERMGLGAAAFPHGQERDHILNTQQMCMSVQLAVSTAEAR
ncbi:cysteine-rich secretory protein LCCL domain-containing 1-like [Arapaima gigas]